MSHKVAVLIPAAGSSSRYKGKRKKQFVDLDGRAVFLRTIEIFADRSDVKQIIVAIPAEDEELFNLKWQANLAFHGVKAVLGGKERHETIEKMLAEVQDDIDLVALHDAVRPCVTQEQIDRVFEAAAQTGAALLAAPLVGTIKKVKADGMVAETVDRFELWEAQTPQVFQLDIIKRAYAEKGKLSKTITDDAQLVEALGLPVKIVESDAGNIKITTGIDLTIATAILKTRADSVKPAKSMGAFDEAQW